VKHVTENEEEGGNHEEGIEISNKLLILLLVGFAVLIAGIIIVIISSIFGSASTSVGGVIFIGPFPIVFGAGPDAIWLIVISIVIAVTMFVLFFAMRRRKYEA
jgi:uncharacterized membrane protein